MRRAVSGCVRAPALAVGLVYCGVGDYALLPLR